MDKKNLVPDLEDSQEVIRRNLAARRNECKGTHCGLLRKTDRPIKERDYTGSVGTLYDSYDVLFGVYEKESDVSTPEYESATNLKLSSPENENEPTPANNAVEDNSHQSDASLRTLFPCNSGNRVIESETSWDKKIKDLEDSRSVPFYKKLNQLKKCFSHNTLADLIAIGIDIYDDEESEETPPVVDEFKRTARLCPPHIDEERPSTPPNRVRRPNPYLNFMRKPETEAKIWRPKPKPNFEDLHLLQKTDLLLKNIINEFYDWFTEVSSENQEYDRETIQELFQIPCPYPIARAIDNNMKLLGCVPDEIAKNTGAPEFSAKFRLREEMARDAAAASQPPRTVAFSKTLPPHLRHKPVKEEFVKRMEEPEKMQQDVTRLAYVWKDISQLYITKAYAMWLNSRADLKVPQLLIDEGILDKKITKMPTVDVAKLNKLKSSKAYENIFQEEPE